MGEEEKQNGQCTMKRGRTGDRRVVRKILMGVAWAAICGHGDTYPGHVWVCSPAAARVCGYPVDHQARSMASITTKGLVDVPGLGCLLGAMLMSEGCTELALPLIGCTPGSVPLHPILQLTWAAQKSWSWWCG